MWTNSITIYGKLVIDPKPFGAREGQEPLAIVRISAMGIRPDDPLFLDCMVFGKTASAVLTHLRKGDHIIVSGRLASKRYTDRQGVEHESFSISVKECQFLIQPREEDNQEVDLDSVPF